MTFEQEVDHMSYETFKERMDYLLDMIREPNITEETKEMVNKSMQLLLYGFNNPVITAKSK